MHRRDEIVLVRLARLIGVGLEAGNALVLAEHLGPSVGHARRPDVAEMAIRTGMFRRVPRSHLSAEGDVGGQIAGNGRDRISAVNRNALYGIKFVIDRERLAGGFDSGLFM